ncbi:MAG: TlyA family RNA methyltransferase [Clostridia bacterium]|nr:TlyA family RNA methyltransferase [Clostridia bacterium]
MRLDVYLVAAGHAASRESAKRLIEEGLVTVDGAVVTKPARDVEGTPAVTVTPKKYVGRGGEKMEAALRLFEIDPTGLRVLDIGASTGGFTDCLLQHGAVSAVTVDAGVGQLHPKLLSDARVRNLEKYNARYLSAADTGRVELAVMDVSFISQTYILPQIPAVLTEDGMLVSLIKPQFEAGRHALNKQGIVRHEKDRIFAVAKVLEAAGAVGLYPAGLAPSPILGGDGNEEFLALFRLTPHGRVIDIEKTVKEKAVILFR